MMNHYDFWLVPIHVIRVIHIIHIIVEYFGLLHQYLSSNHILNNPLCPMCTNELSSLTLGIKVEIIHLAIVELVGSMETLLVGF